MLTDLYQLMNVCWFIPIYEYVYWFIPFYEEIYWFLLKSTKNLQLYTIKIIYHLSIFTTMHNFFTNLTDFE